MGKASLLFSKGEIDKLKIMQNKYAEVKQLDSSISSYFSLLEEMPDYQEIKPQFVEYLQDDSPTDDEENKFEGLCNRTAISTTEPIGNVEYESVVYNFYDLHKKTVRFIPRNYGFTKRYS